MIMIFQSHRRRRRTQTTEKILNSYMPKTSFLYIKHIRCDPPEHNNE
jgi:hypothetical protein